MASVLTRVISLLGRRLEWSKRFLVSQTQFVEPKLNQQVSASICIEQGSFVFYLSETLVLAILQARARRQMLNLPANLIAALQSSIFWNLLHEVDLKQFERSGPFQGFFSRNTDSVRPAHRDKYRGKIWERRPIQSSLPMQTGLTFITDYEGQPVVQSVIGLDGDVFHKVCRAILQDEQSLAISWAHHWLIEQLFLNLRRKTTKYYQRLSWFIALMFSIVPTLVRFKQVGEAFSTDLIFIFTLVLVLVLQIIFHACFRACLPYLRSWLIVQTISPNGLIRWLAQHLMGRLT